jgi:hypothetical protein
MSVDFADVKAAIKARMVDNWTACEVAYGNFAFTPPADADGNQISYIRLRAVERGSQPPIGWNVPETSAACLFGEIHIMACVPVNLGDEAVDQLLTQAKAIFEGVTFNGATTRVQAMESTSAGEGPQDGSWYAKLIVIRMRADNQI